MGWALSAPPARPPCPPAQIPGYGHSVSSMIDPLHRNRLFAVRAFDRMNMVSTILQASESAGSILDAGPRVPEGTRVLPVRFLWECSSWS